MMLMLLFALSLGYLVLVLAKKQEGILKTIGYLLGVTILVLSILHGIARNQDKIASFCKKVCIPCPMMRGK